MRFSPFGVVVGALLSVVASLPLIMPADTAELDPATEQAQAEADRLQAQVDQLTSELADANQRLTALGQPPATPTTGTTAAGTGPQAPSDGLPDVPGTDSAEAPPGVSQPPSSSSPTTMPTTTAPPVVGTTSTTSVSDDGCPPGYRPVAVVSIPPTAARVCLRD